MILLSLLASTLFAAQPAPLPPLAVETRTLSNGLTVLLHEDHSSPLVTVNIWYKVGSKNEQPGKTGFAHLFEHYMFEGSAHSPSGQYFNSVFGMGGETNANTTNDRTDYYAVVPSENLEEVLRLESDRLGFLNINQPNLDKQRKIVKNEKRLRENQPYGGAWEAINAAAWPKGHPYAWPVIGSMADLDAASLADVKAFHDRYYAPNNAVLVVSGDQENARTFMMVEKWFGGLPRSATPPKLQTPAPDYNPGRRDVSITDDKAQMPMLFLIYRIPGKNRPGWQEASVAAQILGGGRTSRLVQALQYDKRMVLSIDASVMGLQEDDLFMIEAMPAPGVDLKRLEAAIVAEVDRLKAQGVTVKELDRVKAGLRTSTLNALQDADGVAAQLAEGQARRGDPSAVITDLNAVSRLQPGPVQDAARKYLTPGNTAGLTILPK